MLVIVEHIREKQDDTTEKINKIHDDLYEPDDGLYARVKMVEAIAADFAKKQTEHLATDERTLISLNESLKKLSEKDDDLGKKAETTLRLKKIAGEDLEKLESMIRVKNIWLNIWSKAVWLLGGGVLAAIGKTVWEIISRK
jgi:type I site-specific restriction endonuclease